MKSAQDAPTGRAAMSASIVASYRPAAIRSMRSERSTPTRWPPPSGVTDQLAAGPRSSTQVDNHRARPGAEPGEFGEYPAAPGSLGKIAENIVVLAGKPIVGSTDHRHMTLSAQGNVEYGQRAIPATAP